MICKKNFQDESKFNDVELVKMMQDDYWAMKNRENKEKRAAEKVLIINYIV